MTFSQCFILLIHCRIIYQLYLIFVKINIVIIITTRTHFLSFSIILTKSQKLFSQSDPDWEYIENEENKIHPEKQCLANISSNLNLHNSVAIFAPNPTRSTVLLSLEIVLACCDHVCVTESSGDSFINMHIHIYAHI